MLVTLDAVVVALSGTWPLSGDATTALASTDGWVVDLSSPPALSEELKGALGDRLTTIDDLVSSSDHASDHLLRRLGALADTTLAEYVAWLDVAPRRAAADALLTRASQAASSQLDTLWRRAPDLSDSQREEIERTVHRATEAVLRDALLTIAEDPDGRYAAAARQLFRI
jgi:glutamyl-tRNA reductase